MKKTVIIMVLMNSLVSAYSQENEPLSISGSVDMYYKYDFSDYQDETGNSNIPTYFGNEQNSISLGMVNLIASKKIGKASFVGDLSFGPRGQNAGSLSGSVPNAADGNSFHIQNLYIRYDLTEKLSLTAGYMGTFIGYEVISPTGSVNYSTSYLFSSGPFQNGGIKANYIFSDKIGLMVGLFNDWNVYQDFNGVSDIGAQLSLKPLEGWDAYVNFLTGDPSGTIFDLTTSYQVTATNKIGFNAADYTATNDGGGYSGGALYLQHSFSDMFSVGARGEYFKSKEVTEAGIRTAGSSVIALTLSANVQAGPITLIPEVRFDNRSENIFMDNDFNPTKNAAQFLVAAVYGF